MTRLEKQSILLKHRDEARQVALVERDAVLGEGAVAAVSQERSHDIPSCKFTHHKDDTSRRLIKPRQEAEECRFAHPGPAHDGHLWRRRPRQFRWKLPLPIAQPRLLSLYAPRL